jgi:hypothetical protein
MIRGASGLLHTSDVTQLLDDVAIKVDSLIAVDSSWKAVFGHEAVVEGFGCCLRRLVLGRYCLRKPGEMIRDDQDVLVSSVTFIVRKYTN